jgi:chemotaxis protein methyltransferase CheR
MMMSMVEPAPPRDVEDLEIELLLEGIWRRYGVDFRDYDRRFIRERVQALLREGGLVTASRLQERVLRDPSPIEAFLDPGEGAAASFFKPARVWRAIRRKAVPILRTYPSVRAWALGGASEGDLPALLILLEEELSRPYTVYATGLHGRRDGQTRFGGFSRSELPGLARSYAAAGGRKKLQDFLRRSNGHAAVNADLKNRVVFASHNLATDSSFNEFQLILARNAMKGFNDALRARAHRLIHDSLVRFGFLVLGAGETLDGSPRAGAYRALDRAAGLYQKMSD